MKAISILSRVAGAAILLLMFGWVISFGGGDAVWFLDLPSLLVVTGAVAGGLLVSCGAVSVLKALGCALGLREAASKAEAETSSAVFARARQLSWAGAALGTVLAVIMILAAESDITAIDARAFALAAIPLLYAIVLAEFVIVPLKSVVDAKSRLRAEGPAEALQLS